MENYVLAGLGLLVLFNILISLVIYKRNDFDDLKNKINYYLDNPNERYNVVNKCYTYFKKNYNMDNLFEELMNK